MKFGKKDILKLFAVIAAAAISAVNMNAFVNAAGLFPGGISGLIVMTQRFALRTWGIEIPYTLLQVILNIGPVMLGAKYLGKKFTLFSCVFMLLQSVLIDIVKFPSITEDILLICIFGGIIGGVAGSICFLFGTSSGGTDFISKYLTVKGKDGMTIIFGFNVILLAVAGLLFGWDKALYSIIYQFTGTEIVKLIYKKYKQDTYFIITDKPEEVCKKISDLTNHGATIFKGTGSYNGEERYMVYSMVSAQDSRLILKGINDVDPAAFINRVQTRQVMGNFHIEEDE